MTSNTHLPGLVPTTRSGCPRGGNSVTAQSVLFVNLRRIPREGLESLLAARRLGYRIVLMGATPPNFARILLYEHYPIDTYDRRLSVELARTIAREHDIAGVANFTE